ncbi:hypothetical protein GGR49_002535 [Sphingomonas carotinifaciens]|nr:hypothetical protein [Sphingomonas carotinifaciens]
MASRILRKLAAYPRQKDPAPALHEVDRIERTLFIIEWILETGMQRRVHVGLTRAKRITRLKTPCASAVRVRSATAPSRLSMTGTDPKLLNSCFRVRNPNIP